MLLVLLSLLTDWMAVATAAALPGVMLAASATATVLLTAGLAVAAEVIYMGEWNTAVVHVVGASLTSY
jgi:hypothetical protein